MAFGVEARVPFLDKEFLRIAMNVDAKHKIHKKGETDSDGKPYMEKVSRGHLPCLWRPHPALTCFPSYAHLRSTSSEKRSTARLMAKSTCPSPSCGVKRNNSVMVSVTITSTGWSPSPSRINRLDGS